MLIALFNDFITYSMINFGCNGIEIKETWIQLFSTIHQGGQGVNRKNCCARLKRAQQILLQYHNTSENASKNMVFSLKTEPAEPEQAEI